MRLPHWLQPWRKLANRIVGREHELYNIFLDHLREAELSGSAPDCFGLTLLKVGYFGQTQECNLTRYAVEESRKY